MICNLIAGGAADFATDNIWFIGKSSAEWAPRTTESIAQVRMEFLPDPRQHY